MIPNTNPEPAQPDEGKIKQIKLPETTWEAFEEQAAKQGLTLSQWLGNQGKAGLPRDINEALRNVERKPSPHVNAARSGMLPAV